LPQNKEEPKIKPLTRIIKEMQRPEFKLPKVLTEDDFVYEHPEP
jgi:hypothetical protein